MNSERKADNTVMDFATFLEHHHLPKTVKIVDGFPGTNDGNTLDVDEILVLHKVVKQQTIMTLDQLGHEICLQQNSKSKVHLLPLEFQEYSTVKELVTAKSSHFLVLDDLNQPSIQIVSGSKLVLPRNRIAIPDYLKCGILEGERYKEVHLPLCLKGRFLPLLDAKDYRLDEVVAQNQLPQNIRFVSQSTGGNHCLSAQPVTSLGNILLTRKNEVEMVFAASIENDLLLYLFPKTLNITVNCEFKVAPETTKKIKECKQALERIDSNLKILDDLIKNSFYFTVCPVTSVSLRLLKIPPVPHPRSRKAKQGKPPEEELSVKREESNSRELVSTTAQNLRSFAPSRKATFGEHRQDRDCGICDEMSEAFTDSRRFEKMNCPSASSKLIGDGIDTNDLITAMEMPPLPPKARTLVSRVEGETKDSQSQSSSLSLPMQKIQFTGAIKVVSEEKPEDCAFQSQAGNFLEYKSKSANNPTTSFQNHFDETGPELPPKPIFLKAMQVHNEEDENEHKECNPPALPAKIKVRDKETSPDKEHVQNEQGGICISRNEIPPPLPPREKLLIDSQQAVPYLIVELADWKKVESYYHGYAVAKDGARVLDQNDADNSYIDVIYEPDERDDYEDTEDERLEKNGEMNQPDVYEKPCDDMESRRGKETQQAEERESSEANPSYDKAVEDFYESSSCVNVRWEKKGKETGPEVTKLSTDFMSRWTESPAAERRQESKERQRLTEAIATQDAVQQVKEESTSDLDGPYEAIEESQDVFENKIPGENTENQDIPGVKNLCTNSNYANSRRSSNTACSPQGGRKQTTTTSRRSRNNDSTWISAPREEDFLDFKEIEQFFKLRKQLNSARAEVEDLKKQVAVKQEESTADKTRTPLDSNGASGSSRNVGHSKQVDIKNSKSEDNNNHNILASTRTFPKRTKKNCQNGTGLGDSSGKKIGKKTPNSHSPAKQREMSQPFVRRVTLSSDDDVYEECNERKYVNQEISVESKPAYYVNVSNEERGSGGISEDGNGASNYYNKVEVETSRYLQLGNPSEEEENVYANVDTKESDQEVAEHISRDILGNEVSILGSSAFDRTATDHVDPSGGQECNTPPPLPPKLKT